MAHVEVAGAKPLLEEAGVSSFCIRSSWYPCLEMAERAGRQQNIGVCLGRGGE
jgi:hypothetical protein